MPGKDTQQMAAWAAGLQAKLQCLDVHLADGWCGSLGPAWQAVTGLPAGRQRAALVARLAVDLCGGLPKLEHLGDPAARWALLPVDKLLQALTALALARRPGVLRCCLDRRARSDLRQAIGPQHDAVLACLPHGRPVPEALTQVSAMQWAAVGYHDWRQSLTTPPGAMAPLVALVGLSLPPEAARQRPATHLTQAEAGAREALLLLSETAAPAPC